ncbi:lanthionine synthetase LanC family protein [Chitinophaga nivalis]|uniref:Lanthionine synthetase n=1 Tax=Chitinophaga nivalis TaxID=2991709 RepID=A0ABT3ILA1_9BACT|nr:lanthionine synthetase LanC family protein [Chitinophaga nivalis]MCW3465567.1 hypothetical protein [Chitinophaga nivalis]MCW3484742.1 hypothetical protein [Chitinophaga nivalis]
MKPNEIQATIYKDMVAMLQQKSYGQEYADSLFKGPWGALFYLFYYEQYVDDTENHAATFMEKLYEELDTEKNYAYSYCTGLTGPFWLLHHLNKHEFVDIDMDYLIPDFITAAILDSEAHIYSKNFDFLHGSAGICNLLVAYADRPEVRTHLEKFVAGLMDISVMTEKGRSLPVFFMMEVKADTGVDSFSLAHGSCSLLILLLKIHQAGIATDTCRQLVYESIPFIMNHKNEVKEDGTTALYPGILDGESDYSRLSWCYGDFNVALALWYCGKYFQEEKWKQEALDIMHYSIKRDTDTTAGIVDTCLCHGSGGIAAFYRKFWYETNDIAFYHSAEHWHNITLDKLVFSEEANVHGVRAWQGKDKQWEYCWDLLDGSCGVGLALLSHDQQEPLPWDEFLLLS